MAASCRPAAATDALEVGRLRVQHPVEVASHRARNLPRLELEQRRPGTDQAQERADGLGALPGDDAAPAAKPPRRRKAHRGEPVGERPRLFGGHDELEVRPCGCDAQRTAREEQAAQPGEPAMLGRGVPIERGLGGARVPRRRARSSLAGPHQPEAQARDGPQSGLRRAGKTGDLRLPVARPRRRDGGQLGAERRDEVAVSRRPSPEPGITPNVPPQTASAPTAAEPDLRVPRPSAARPPGAPGRDDARSPDRRHRRARAAASTRPPAASAAAPAAAPHGVGGRAANWLFASTTSTMPGAVWASRASTMVGEVEAVGLAALGRDVAGVHAERRRGHRSRRGSRAGAGSAGWT